MAIELYYPETKATKKIDANGKIFFSLSFSNDLKTDLTPINNNFATTTTKMKAHNLYIISSEKLPSLSDPNYPNNFATHYLVISQGTQSNNINNCLAIPICNDYEGPWSKYAKKINKTQAKSVDKLIQNLKSVLIDLNATMSELTGNESIGSYKKYDNIEMFFPNENQIATKSKLSLYIIDKFIYVEPVIKASLYSELIQISYKRRAQDSTAKYEIASVSAKCENTTAAKDPSPLFDIGKPDDMSNFIYTNVGIIFSWIIILFLFSVLNKKYNIHWGIKLFLLIIACLPIIIYFSIYKGGSINAILTSDAAQSIKNSDVAQSIKNSDIAQSSQSSDDEMGTAAAKAEAEAQAKKAKAQAQAKSFEGLAYVMNELGIDPRETIQYLLRYLVIYMLYSIIVVSGILLMIIKNMINESNMNLFEYVKQFILGSWNKIVGFFPRMYRFIIGIMPWAQFSSYFVNEILTPGFKFLIFFYIVSLLIMGSIVLAGVKII
jgi:hypothetical protein